MFWFSYLWQLVKLGTFSCTCWSSNAFFGKTSIQIFCSLFNQSVYFLPLSCVSSLYILDINPLSDIWFANIFSHSVACLFILLIYPLLCRSLLVDAVSLVYFCFWCQIQNIITKTDVTNLLPMFSSRSLVVSVLT